MKSFDVETQPLDFIPDGETFTTKEGQTVILGPVFVEGELKIIGNLIIA